MMTGLGRWWFHSYPASWFWSQVAQNVAGLQKLDRAGRRVSYFNLFASYIFYVYFMQAEKSKLDELVQQYHGLYIKRLEELFNANKDIYAGDSKLSLVVNWQSLENQSLITEGNFISQTI